LHLFIWVLQSMVWAAMCQLTGMCTALASCCWRCLQETACLKMGWTFTITLKWHCMAEFRRLWNQYILLREDVESSIHSSHRMNHIETGKILECLISIIKIGVACSVELPRARMDMSIVVAELHRIRDILSGTRIRGQLENVSLREGKFLLL